MTPFLTNFRPCRLKRGDHPADRPRMIEFRMRSLGPNETWPQASHGFEPAGLNPFRGLRPYKARSVPGLFGRQRDWAIVRDRILSNRATILMGGPRVGATSFIQAMLVSR